MTAEKELIELSANQIKGFRLPRWKDFPDLDIYMDQLISLISRYFKGYPGYEENSLTPSMVNNYVKQGIMPAPQNKKYNRVHLSSLVIINILKTSIPIARIGEIISEGISSNEGPEKLYDSFCDGFEETCEAVAQAVLDTAFKGGSLSDAVILTAMKSSAEQSLALDLIKSRK